MLDCIQYRKYCTKLSANLLPCMTANLRNRPIRYSIRWRRLSSPSGCVMSHRSSLRQSNKSMWQEPAVLTRFYNSHTEPQHLFVWRQRIIEIYLFRRADWFYFRYPSLGRSILVDFNRHKSLHSLNWATLIRCRPFLLRYSESAAMHSAVNNFSFFPGS